MNSSVRARPRLAVVGIRGVPGAHGGFETFAARLAPHLASNGWDVTVYCQEDQAPLETAGATNRWRSTWEGVRRVHIAVGGDTPVNSVRYDLACIADVVKHPVDVVLILGYNTAIFSARLRLAGIPVVLNMDGIEWSRQKWNALSKLWLRLNELAGCQLARHLIADHPGIASHLSDRVSSERISVIPYGADLLEAQNDDEILSRFGVASGRLITVIARAEPENSILEIVRAFSRKPRGVKMLILGRYHTERVRYHSAVVAAASADVLFAGPVYDKSSVQALRRQSMFYMHGHQVGGCNPSLVEAMGAGNAIIAHDNSFNRWVARDGALYFADEASCEAAIEQLLEDPQQCRQFGALNRCRAGKVFNWTDVLQSYDDLLTQVASEGAAASESDWGRRAFWQSDPDPS